MTRRRKTPRQRRPKGTGSLVRRSNRDGGEDIYCRWRIDGKPVERKAKSEHAGNRVLSRVEDLVEGGLDQMAAIRAALGEPEPRDEEITLVTLAERYLDYLELTGKRTPANLGGERSRSRYINDHALGQKLVHDIQRADAARWAEDLLRGGLDGKPKSGKTVNRALSLASRVWRYGQNHGHTAEDRNPFRQVERHPEPPIDKDPLTPAEVEALISHADDDFQPLLQAGLHTGAKAGELMSLTWADIDLRAGHLTIRTSREKTRRGRQVPLTAELEATLRRLKTAKGIHRHPTSLVFTGEDGQGLGATRPRTESSGTPWTAVRTRRSRPTSAPRSRSRG